jgi:hypothetical protein
VVVRVKDVVYVVKHLDHNPELRWSLRTLANLPHDRVWIAGYRPSWVSPDVGCVSVAKGIDKYRSSTANLIAACAHPEVADDFYLFNDDFFVMEPADAIPALHRGPLSEVESYYDRIGSTSYLGGLRETAAFMTEALGLDDLLSYELHVPLPVDKDRMAEALTLPTRFGRPIRALHKRTLYGNFHAIGGDRAADVKVFGRANRSYRELPLLSTADNTFQHGEVGRYIRKRFPEKSPYER